MEIIRIWEQMDPDDYAVFPDSHIHTGIPLNRMTTAAEILRYGSCEGDELAWTDADTEFIERKFSIYGLGSPPELQKFVCGKVLYNYDSLEPSERKLVI